MELLPRFKAFLLFFALYLFPAFAGAQPVRGVAGDLWADLVLGQPGFGSLSPGTTAASGIYLPGGIAADSNPNHHRLYVWDAGNSRVLGFSDTTKFQPNASTALTSDGLFGYRADIVLGQPDFSHSGCNGDNNDQNWPGYVPPSQTSLCGMWQRQGSISEGGSFSSMAVDPATGDLYVADVFNNRVLRFAYGDLTPGAAGVPASGVWGQPDYNSFLTNQGLSAPTNSTLYFGGTPVLSVVGPCADAAGGSVGAVGFDSQHNLWVADTRNNRVLRFPAGSGGIPQSSADIVLGQSGFTTNANTNLSSPFFVRADANGNVYVMDTSDRVLIFDAVTYSGSPADATPDLIYSSNLSFPFGIDMDGSNNLWVANTNSAGSQGSGNVVEFKPNFNANGSVAGLQPINALMQDTLPPTPPNGSVVESGPDFSYTGGGSNSSAFIQNPLEVAVDGTGNVYVSSKGSFENICRYPGPIPTPQSGHVYSADVEVFKQTQYGQSVPYGLNGIAQVYGVAVGQDNPSPQLIVADAYRLDYWNIPGGPQGLANGQAPDGYAGVNSANVTLPASTGNSFTRLRVDHSTGATGGQHLWAIAHGETAQIYNLPLANWASPSASFSTGIPVLGAPSSLVDWNSGLGGLYDLDDIMPCASVSAPYASGPVSYLWVVDNIRSRVFRVRDPLGKLGLGPVVDILIGQTTAANNVCWNFGTQTAGGCVGAIPENQYTLNQPGSAELDHAGNLYVSDSQLETAGNWRFLEYDESEIAQATQASVTQNMIQFLSASPYTGATHVYGNNGQFTSSCAEPAPASNPTAFLCRPFQAAFPSDDRALVVAGFELHPLVIPDPHSNFDPTNPSDPWAHLDDFYSNMYSTAFDNQDNLYTIDSNRSRVLVYYNPIPTVPSTPTATATNTPSPTPTNTATATPTDTPTPAITSTATNFPTSTPTATPTPSPTVTLTSTPSVSPTEGCHDPGFYPNPCRDSLHLHFSPCDQGREAHVKIFTVVSRKALDKDIPQAPVGTDFDLELKDNWGTPLSNGLYYLVIDRPEGRFIGKLLILR